MQPINYSIDVQQPFEAALKGYQLGGAIRTDQLAQQQAVLQREQQARQQQLLAELAAKPNATAADYAAVMTQLPSLAEPLKKAWEIKSPAQQQAHASDLLQWGAAIKSGRPDVAANRMIERADAMEQAAGGATPESKALRANAGVVKENPEFALGQIQAILTANPNGKQAADTLASFGAESRAAAKAPIELRQAEATATSAEAAAKVAPTVQQATAEKAVADAKTAGVTAKFAESQAVVDLEKKGWDVKALQADIDFKRQSARIAAMNASLAKEGNDIRKRELQMKLDDAVAARDTKLREKVAGAESGAASIDNMLNTIERIKTNPNLNDVLGGIEGRMPAVADGSVDAIALIETLGSQAFLAQIPNIKGMGALSNAEGEKLQSALQNLGRTQSEKQFLANLNEATRLLTKGRESLAKSTGVPLGKPDTPAKPTAPTGGVTVSGW